MKLCLPHTQSALGIDWFLFSLAVRTKQCGSAEYTECRTIGRYKWWGCGGYPELVKVEEHKLGKMRRECIPGREKVRVLKGWQEVSTGLALVNIHCQGQSLLSRGWADFWPAKSSPGNSQVLPGDCFASVKTLRSEWSDWKERVAWMICGVVSLASVFIYSFIGWLVDWCYMNGCFACMYVRATHARSAHEGQNRMSNPY